MKVKTAVKCLTQHFLTAAGVYLIASEFSTGSIQETLVNSLADGAGTGMLLGGVLWSLLSAGYATQTSDTPSQTNTDDRPTQHL